MTHLPPDCDFDVPIDIRREQRPAPDAAHALTYQRRARPEGWRPGGVVVHARPGEHAAKLIRRFVTMVMREGVLVDARRREHAIRPGERRRVKRARAAARRRKAGRE